MGVRLEGVEVDLMALLDGVEEVFEAEVELGGGDFLAAFLFVDARVVATNGGELGFGGFDGFHQFATAGGAGFDFDLEVFDFAAVLFGFLGEACVFGDGGFDALVERGDFRFAADGDFAEFGEAGLHGLLLFLGGLFGAAFDCELGAELVEGLGHRLLAGDGGVGFGLEATAFGFEGFEAFAGGGEFGFEVFAAFGGGLLAFFEFAAFPFDVLDAGFEVFDFAGGEAELALEGGEVDFLALEALAGEFDFLAELFEAAFEFGDSGACGFVGDGELRDFGIERADFVGAL